MAIWILALALALAPPLSEAHRAWLEEEVHFLISSREREEFLSLDSERSRRQFIENFWRRRDPAPETARNERRERHLGLLAEADRVFSLIGSRRGRFTERGRVYQLLGPPLSRSDFVRSANRLYPLELWQYSGVAEPFLPESFYLIFFREGGFGDYRLWSPTADGPQALIAVKDPGRFALQPELAYRELRRIDIELATAVERLVPGEPEDLPAFAAESLLTNLREFADIAERHLRLAAEVTARVSFRRMEVSAVAIALGDATGIPQVHYALEVPSSNVSWVEEGARHRTSFNLSCLFVDREGRESDRIEDPIDLDLSADERVELQDTPLSFQGRLALAPGRYRLEFSLSNRPGGATDTLSIPVEVPEGEGAGASGILLARSRARLPGGELLENRPFQIGDLLVSPAPDAVFPAAQAFAYLQFWGLPEGSLVSWSLSRGEKTVWERESQLPRAGERPLTVEQVLPLAGLADGNYRLRVRFPGGEQETEVRVAADARVRAVRVLAREALPAGHGRIRFQLGLQFARRGETARAIEEMTEAARLLPRDLEVHHKLAFLLSSTSQHQKVLELLLPIEPHYPRDPDLLVFLGFASLKLGRFAEASSYYERALSERPGDGRIQTALAEARRLKGAPEKR